MFPIFDWGRLYSDSVLLTNRLVVVWSGHPASKSRPETVGSWFFWGKGGLGGRRGGGERREFFHTLRKERVLFFSRQKW